MIDFNNKTILISGGNGCIGQGLINYFRTLVNNGVNVKIVVTSKSKYPKYMHKIYQEGWAKFFQCSMENNNWCHFLWRRGTYDCIFHLAGSAVPSEFTKTPYDTYALHVGGTMKVLELASYSNAQVFYASSSEVYGDNPSVVPTPESYVNIDCHPAHPRACYTMGKIAAENAILMCNKQFGTNHKIGRIALCYGPGIPLNDSRILPTLIRRGLEEKSMYLSDRGLAERTYIYINDCITKMINILEGKDTIYNIGGTNTYKIIDIGLIIAELLGIPSGEYEQFGIGEIKGSPNRVCLSNQKYDSEFGPIINPVNIRDGITNMINFYREQEIWEKSLV